MIAVSETWLKNDEYVYLNSYHCVGKGRAEKRGGGVGFYIGTGWKFRRRSDLDIFNDFIFIQIYCEYSNKIRAIFYRPPAQSIPFFLNALELPLYQVTKEGKKVF